MTCPAADFVEESFLLTVKDALSEQGLFIVNLVSRSQAIKDMVISKMKMVRMEDVCVGVCEHHQSISPCFCSWLFQSTCGSKLT